MFPYQITSLGFNTIQLPTSGPTVTYISPGYVVGSYTTSDQGQIGVRNVTASELAERVAAPPPSVAVNSQISVPYSVSNYRHVVRATGVRPSNMTLFPRFSVSSNYTLTVTINTTRIFSSMTVTSSIAVEIPVNNTVLSCPTYAATNSTVNITILPHQGKIIVPC